MRTIATRGRLVAALGVLAVLAATTTAQAEPVDTQPKPAPRFDQQVLFDPQLEQGYACFRIPAVTRTAAGTLLAFAEGRVENCGDTGDIDLVVKRSTDGGRTWSPLRLVNSGNGDTHGNPVPIVDRESGRIVLISTYNEGRDDDKPCDIPCRRTPHSQFSEDDGLTWSRATDISVEASRPDWDSWYASGPAHGIQLTHGRYAGRLVFGVNAETSDGTEPTVNHAALVHSDDHGASWRVGAVDSYPVTDGTDFTQKPSEMGITELADGSVYVNGREQDGTDIGNRDHTISRDGGESFGTPFTTIPDLVTPKVQGSVLRLERAGRGDRMLFSSPSDTERRRWMMIRSSYDEGRHWENAEQGTRITDDWSGYSDMVQLSGPEVASAEIGLLYEGGAVDARDQIRFARFTEEYLGWRNTAGPVTPDTSPSTVDSRVIGGAGPVEGRYGRAVELDGVDDYIRVPYHPAQPPGDGDVTWTGWVRYGASRADQVLFWLGGMGESTPQLWLRGEPGGGRMVATMITAEGSRTITSIGAHDDQRWHHVALLRSAGALRLLVDGAEVAAGDAVGGSVSETVSFQLLLGERLDGVQRLAGALDDVRLYDRALSAAELDRIRQSNADVADGQVLRLPFDRIARERD